MKKPFRDIQSALETVIDSSRKHASASQQGEYKVANKNYERLVKALHFLREHDALAELRPLMNHDETCVRFVVSAFMLRHHEQEALLALRDIAARAEPYFATDAAIVLEQWKKGELKF